jgi:hypothetical protein
MIRFDQAFGGGGAVLAPALSTNFFTSRTWTAPQDGIVVFRGMGAGGGGANGTNATGGYSGSWGAKVLRVKKGNTVVVSIGAGGAGRIGTAGDGTAGGNTTVVVGGVTYTAFGGLGGKSGSASTPANGPSPSSNWDFGADSVRPGWAAGSVVTGGAGVDILEQGNNTTTSASVNGSGGGGTGAASSTGPGGGAMGLRDLLGRSVDVNGRPSYADGGLADWGIPFFGGAGGIAAYPGGANGGGGLGLASGSAQFAGDGGIGGGGGANGSVTSGSATGGQGGLGGGGGGGVVNGGVGGNGYAHLDFYADTGV